MHTLLLIPLLMTLAADAQVQMDPERTVQNNLIISDRDPNVRIRLPKAAQYVGADRWILYDIADCELHAFVDADADKNVQRLYWVQFEGYLPTKPELHHQYDSPRHITIGGLDFYVDTWVESNDAKEKPSDGEHIEGLICSKGYKLPARMMCVRLVHLLDKQKRKELMIIYEEDLASTGYPAAELRPGGRTYDRWPAIKEDLIKRVAKNIVID